MAQVSKIKMDIGGVPKIITIYNHNKDSGSPNNSIFNYLVDGDQNTASDPDTSKMAGIHYIHVLDRSYSMTPHIDDLIDNVEQCVKVMRHNDLLSVIWFAGSDQCETVIKGSKKGPELNNLLNSLRSTVGVTCFSTPLKEIRKCVEDTKIMCPDFMVTFFTDGNPVTEWSTAEEYDRIEKELMEMPSNVIALNTIGYGYYNRDLLQTMSEASTLGKTFHSQQIKEYYEIFQHNQERTLGLSTEEISFASSNTGDKILYMSDKDSSIFHSNSVTLTKWSQDLNFVIVISDEEGQVDINGTIHETRNLPSDILNYSFNNHFLYTLAYELYYTGHTRESLDILSKNLKDKKLVDEHLKAFTNRERQDFIDLLCKASFKSEYRHQEGQCAVDYVPAADAPCVLDIFEILTSSEGSYYLPQKSTYERTTRKVTDEDNKFTPNDGEIKAPIFDMEWAESRLNLTLKYPIAGVVRLDPKEAERVGLPETVDATIWRSHTFIKDGEPHIQEASFLVTKDTLDKISKIQIPNVTNSSREDGLIETIINFESLPVTNQNFVERSLDLNTVFDLTRTTLELKAIQKVVNYFSKKIVEARALTEKKDGFQHLSLDQIEVMKDHGINAQMWYTPVSSTMKKTGESDYYEVRKFDFKIKGMTSLPSLGDLEKRIQALASGSSKAKKRDLNFVEELMKKYKAELEDKLDFDNPSFATRDKISQEQKTIKGALQKTRASLSILKMSRVLTGDWWPDLEADDKGNYTWKKDDHTMVAKVTREKQYV